MKHRFEKLLVRLGMVAVLAVLLAGSIITYVRFGIVDDEGYPTWEAARNYILRDGGVTIALPSSVTPVAVECSGDEQAVMIAGNTVSLKIGYTACEIDVDVVTVAEKESRTYQFSISKFNSWNRIRIEPMNDGFDVYENGVFVERIESPWKIDSSKKDGDADQTTAALDPKSK